jgi:hypothetical protein
VLVACVICVIALYAIVGVMSAAQTATMKGDYYNVANKAAADVISADEAAGYSALTDGTTVSSVPNIPSGSLTVTIGPLNANPANTNIKEIDADVTWTGGSGAAKLGGQVTLSTCISAP